MTPPAVPHLRCIHDDDEHNPVRHTERLNDLEERAEKHDKQWDQLVGPEGALTKLTERLARVEVKVAIAAAGAVGAIEVLKGLKSLVAPVARAAGLTP